jgi:hypothetical protein
MRVPIIVTACVAVAGVATPAAAEPPTSGTCFSYSAEQWVQTPFTAGLVDCATGHNGEVLGTVYLPEEIATAGYGSSAAKGWAVRACQPLAVAYAWTKPKPKFPKPTYVMPRTARLNVQFPTAAEWDTGQRWATCLGQSRNTGLTRAQTRTGSVAARGLKPYVCLNPRGWRGMKCSKPDAVRLTNQVWIPTSYTQSYPGTNRMLKKTQKACRKLAKKRKKWTLRTYYVPGKAAWDRGNRYGFCEIIK